jgi:hypothetical protein
MLSSELGYLKLKRFTNTSGSLSRAKNQASRLSLLHGQQNGAIGLPPYHESTRVRSPVSEVQTSSHRTCRPVPVLAHKEEGNLSNNERKTAITVGQGG